MEELAEALEEHLHVMESTLRDVVEVLYGLGPLVVEETGALNAAEAAVDVECVADTLEHVAKTLSPGLPDAFSKLPSVVTTVEKYLAIGEGGGRRATAG